MLIVLSSVTYTEYKSTFYRTYSAVDTTGAGDSFWGGFLASYLQEETSPEHLTRAQMIQFGRVGNAVASLCVERRGGISAIPEMEEIEERLRG